MEAVSTGFDPVQLRETRGRHLAAGLGHGQALVVRVHVPVDLPRLPRLLLQVRKAHTAALEVTLCVVPGRGDGVAGQAWVVLLDGVRHLRPQVVLDLTPEHVAEDAADEEDDEHEEEEDEVGDEHALDLLERAEAPEEADEDDGHARDHEDVGRADEELVAEETLDVRLVHQGPHPHAQDYQSSKKYEEVDKEQRPFDEFPAALHVGTQSHCGYFFGDVL